MKRILALAIALVMVFALAATASATEYLYLATGGTSGTYYALGGDMANLFAKNIADLDVTAQSTGASAENIRLIDQGEAELAIVQNDVAAYAFDGTALFEGEKIDTFAVVASLYPELVQLVVHNDAGIKSVADLKGKRISVGAAGSGTYFNAVQFLEMGGLTIDDVEPQYLSFAESGDAIKNRQIDAAFITAGIPNAAIQELGATSDITVLNLTDAEIADIQSKYPYYAKATIPAGTYQSMDEDIVTVAIRAILICPADLDEEMVYNLTKTLFEKTDELSHAKKAEIAVADALLGVSTPVHPGAERYYAEAGIK